MTKKRVSLSAEQAAVIQGAFRNGAICTDVLGNFFFPGGEVINPRTARALIEAGFLVPQKDGMFGSSQTFKPNLV